MITDKFLIRLYDWAFPPDAAASGRFLVPQAWALSVRAKRNPCTEFMGAVGALALLLGLPPAALAQGAMPALVKVDEVRREPVSQTVPVIGRLVARQAGDIAARVAGAVVELRVHVGDRVKAGDVIAVLSTERLAAERSVREAQVRVAGAKVRTTREEVKLFRQELKRLTDLRKSEKTLSTGFRTAINSLASGKNRYILSATTG